VVAVALGSPVEQQLILDRYRPLESLGEGGFGEVVLAWDTRMQRRVAIKRLALPLDERGNPTRPPGLAEARTAAMLNHPAIVTVFDFDLDADEAFIVMEHVDGSSLSEILDRLGEPLTLDECAAIADAVSSALTFAHDNGVLHLDIKPDNVLVARDGRVKVADFGMAALSSASGHGPAWGGTVGYMPLEQLEGQRVSARTDEWALASMLYEALTGDNPFVESSPQAGIVRLEVNDVAAPSTVTGDLPPELDDVLLAALGLRPSDRYPSVAEFAEELLPLLGDVQGGRESLACVVDDITDESESDSVAPSLSDVGLWDRLAGRLGGVLLRGSAAVEAGWLSWAGLTGTSLERPALWAAIALVSAAGLLAPSLGVLLGIGCLVAGLITSGAVVVASAVVLGTGVWWWFVARRDPGAAVLPLAAPVLAAGFAGTAQPLIAGFALRRPASAAVTGLFGGVLAVSASALSAQSAPYLWVWLPDAASPERYDLAMNSLRVLWTSWPVYLALLGWPAAAALMSWACRRATRPSAALGAVGGGAVLAFAYLLADEAGQRLGIEQRWMSPQAGGALLGSLILVLLVVALGPPLRAEEDETPLFVADDEL
jgi:hypothetical protein